MRIVQIKTRNQVMIYLLFTLKHIIINEFKEYRVCINTAKQMSEDSNIKSKEATKTVGEIIRHLMHEYGDIKESELARQTGLPQATINRVLLGGTNDPRGSTLKPIAAFFNITIGQLLGEEPLDQLQPHSNYTPTRESSNPVPILSWEEAINWQTIKHEINAANHTDWIVIEKEIDPDAFAVRSNASLEPIFPKGAILIFSTKKEYVDGTYVLVNFNNNIALKKIIINEDVYLEHIFNKNIPPTKLDNNKSKIIGQLVETRIYF